MTFGDGVALFGIWFGGAMFAMSCGKMYHYFIPVLIVFDILFTVLFVSSRTVYPVKVPFEEQG